jgi:NAD(P)-dependent dehydrogenase (short-subunit alcohol dehydrogenase family)
MGLLEGKVAFITGAARGQGRSHALTLAREGADIIAVDICRQAQTVPYPMATPDDLAETVKEVEALDRRIIASEVDVRDLAALTAAVNDGVAELAPQSIRVNTVHPTTVATDMILNEPTYRLFRPDLENPTREDFEVAARTLNKLPVAALEPADISNAILYLVSDAGRYVTGITHVVDAGGQL